MKRLNRPGLGGLLAALIVPTLAVLALLCVEAAHAQTNNFLAPPNTLQPPFDYPTILNAVTPVLIFNINPARRRIIFFNPSQTATIAFCPSQVTRPGVTFTCAVNGAGSITLLPLASFVLDGGTPQGPPLAMGAAWFGVASAANAPSTVFEFE